MKRGVAEPVRSEACWQDVRSICSTGIVEFSLLGISVAKYKVEYWILNDEEKRI